MNTQIKLTTAQVTILHVLFTIIVGAAVAGFSATAGLSGGFNLSEFLRIFCSAALTSLIAGLVLLRTNPQLAQAVTDTLNEVRGSNNQLAATLLQVAANLPSPSQAAQQQPPVIVNMAQPRAEQPVSIDTGAAHVQPSPTMPAQRFVQPQQQFAPPTPLASLSNGPTLTRHFGDTGIVPTPPRQ